MNAAVLLAQRRLGLMADGVWTMNLYHLIRAFQMESGLMVTGVLDRPTMSALGDLAHHDPPRWEPTMQQHNKE